jgi:hypothetical protein
MRTLLGALFGWRGGLGGGLFGRPLLCFLARHRDLFAPRPLDLGVVEGAQDLVDECLVSLALGAEPLKDVAVEPQGDDVLSRRDDDAGFVPIDVERGHGGIAGDGARDIVVGHGVEAGVVGFVL